MLEQKQQPVKYIAILQVVAWHQDFFVNFTIQFDVPNLFSLRHLICLANGSIPCGKKKIELKSAPVGSKTDIES